MQEVRHVVVVGGGVAGCAAAHALAAVGVGVTIVEREGVATQASAWSAGGLNPIHGVPAPLAPLAMASYRAHLALWPEIEQLTGRPLGGELIDLALIATNESELSSLRADAAAFERAEGFSARWLDRGELLDLEPRLAPHVLGGLLTHGNGVVDSRELTDRLAEAAGLLGATVRAGAVVGLRHEQRAVTGVVLADGVIACDAVVLAMGPWTGAAAAWLDAPLPVEPLKGEIVRVAPPGRPLACDLVTPAVSLFSRDGGQVWIGSTKESRGFDREISASARDQLRSSAAELLPSLAEAALVRQTACLRPVTPDGMPIVGPVPGWSGAYVATGGGQKGILLAPAMGRAVADLLLNGTTAIPLAGCEAGRF